MCNSFKGRLSGRRLGLCTATRRLVTGGGFGAAVSLARPKGICGGICLASSPRAASVTVPIGRSSRRTALMAAIGSCTLICFGCRLSAFSKGASPSTSTGTSSGSRNFCCRCLRPQTVLTCGFKALSLAATRRGDGSYAIGDGKEGLFEGSVAVSTARAGTSKGTGVGLTFSRP